MSSPSLALQVARRWRRAAFELNPPLILGGVLAALIIICAVAAPLIAPFDPYDAKVFFDEGRMARMPYPPGSYDMLLGSDSAGRDLLSRLIYGSRYTLLFCGLAALLRVLLGTTLGMLAGWYNHASQAFDVLVSSWSAVPSLIFAIAPISIVSLRSDLNTSMTVFVLALSLTGWAEAAVRVRLEVQSVRATAFVEAAYSVGLSRAAVLWRHILPNLRDLLLIEAVYALAAALLLVAELGFLNFFVGAAERDTLGVFPIQAEWGGMLARGLRERGSGLWLLLAPMGAFTLTILAFNLLAEGLRRRR
ncbi:MAG TPA: ABC transporter permease [Roseiflexaceae bacterium]|nr:ABC transporter permease [Roseiflexaceae bacterium]